MDGKHLKLKTMFKKIFFIFTVTVCASLFCSCGRDNVNEPHGSTAVPKQVTVREVIDREGSSVIYFNLPDDKNIKYVRAAWTTDDGKEIDATASFYTDSLVVYGFKDACSVDVRLYSVSTGNVASEPVVQPVNPLTPPYLAIAQRMAIGAGIDPYFLGLRVDVPNPTQARLSFYTYKANSEIPGGWQEIGQYYSSAPTVSYRIGKQDTLPTTFAVRIKDNFDHWSEYQAFEITPWWEEPCDKSKYAECKVHRINESGERAFDSKCLDWDGHQMHSWSGSAVAFNKLWDNSKMVSAANCYHTLPSTEKDLPQSFCIDLGKEYKLSRALVWVRASDTRMGGSTDDWQHVWKGGMPKHVRIYGSTYLGDYPADYLEDNISDPSWLLIGETIFTKADGSSEPELSTTSYGTDDDRRKLEDGLEIIFDTPPGQKIRYVRFQTVELYSPTKAVMISELEYLGSDK
jgi:hypothetical protein